eukprot:TRINITY_DN3962_c0_g1::TRINITY_DN3962_c0_g1_i1::g.1756::m.1756 TRINITY_DN3962_c0_g1::TRINITY_DN3962_c0_g1_i1::g.1756  ORF type:complete len:117 (-),score=-12.83,RHH_2/PF03693.9/0.15 TRINITY_DN3962_c0_g1_i1:125-475(-)
MVLRMIPECVQCPRIDCPPNARIRFRIYRTNSRIPNKLLRVTFPLPRNNGSLLIRSIAFGHKVQGVRCRSGLKLLTENEKYLLSTRQAIIAKLLVGPRELTASLHSIYFIISCQNG